MNIQLLCTQRPSSSDRKKTPEGYGGSAFKTEWAVLLSTEPRNRNGGCCTTFWSLDPGQLNMNTLTLWH